MASKILNCEFLEVASLNYKVCFYNKRLDFRFWLETSMPPTAEVEQLGPSSHHQPQPPPPAPLGESEKAALGGGSHSIRTKEGRYKNAKCLGQQPSATLASG